MSSITETASPAQAPVLTCSRLCKSYRAGQPVLQDLNINLTGGKIVGLLGPNGCGKSTLLKLISGLLVPDSGEISVCGAPRSEASNALISYLPERTYFNNSMRMEDMIALFSDFFPDFDEACARHMLADLGIRTDRHVKHTEKCTQDQEHHTCPHQIISFKKYAPQKCQFKNCCKHQQNKLGRCTLPEFILH